MANVITEDDRQHKGKHELKHAWFAEHGIELERKRLEFGDYMHEGSNVSVDTKRDIDEIARNFCSTKKEHARVRREIDRARDAGYSLVFLVENTCGITSLDELPKWTAAVCVKCGYRKASMCVPHNPKGACITRKSKHKPVQGPRLAKTLATVQKRYGCKVVFCKPEESAAKICELLGVEYE